MRLPTVEGSLLLGTTAWEVIEFVTWQRAVGMDDVSRYADIRYRKHLHWVYCT